MTKHEQLLDELEDRINDCDNPLAGLKLYDFQKQLQDAARDVQSFEKAIREYQEAKGKVNNPEIISVQLDDYQDKLTALRDDLGGSCDKIESYLNEHDTGEIELSRPDGLDGRGEDIFNQLSERFESSDNFLAKMKLVEFQERLVEQHDRVQVSREVFRAYDDLTVDEDSLVSEHLSEYEEEMRSNEDDYSNIIDFIGEVLNAHDDGEELIPFINQYQRKKAQELVESGEIAMGVDPTV